MEAILEKVVSQVNAVCSRLQMVDRKGQLAMVSGPTQGLLGSPKSNSPSSSLDRRCAGWWIFKDLYNNWYTGGSIGWREAGDYGLRMS